MQLSLQTFELPLNSIPCGSAGEESTCNSGDPGSIPGSGRSPGERDGNPLQYSWLQNPMDTEPGGLQSMGSLRVGHDWATFTFFLNSIILTWNFYKYGLFYYCLLIPPQFLNSVYHDLWNSLLINRNIYCIFKISSRHSLSSCSYSNMTLLWDVASTQPALLIAGEICILCEPHCHF